MTQDVQYFASVLSPISCRALAQVSMSDFARTGANARRLILITFVLVLVGLSFVTVGEAWAQETAPSVKVAQLKAHLDAAEAAYRDQDAAKVTEHVNQAIGVLKEILQATRREDVAEIRSQHKRLVAAHRILRNARAKPEPLPQLKFNYVEADPMENDMSETRVSFQNTIAPLIAQKCGRCHVTQTRGGTSLATSADLSIHVFPGDSSRSYLFEIVENDTMPQGNNKLTDDEKNTLKLWIEQGGQLDPGQTTFDLRTLVQSAPPAEMAPVARATESDTVFFSKHVAPLLAESCNGCHVEANQLRGGLSLDNFTRLMRGGDSGTLVVPGNPDESLLIKKLKGTADGQQMPINRPKWSDEQINLVSTWIREGARYDALEPEQSVVDLARRSAIESMTTEEMHARRSELLLKNWKLALVDQPYQQGQSDHFDWIAGDKVDVKRIEQWVKLVEQEYKRRQSALEIEPNNAFAQGRIALFVPGSNYDYSEFAKMLSRRDANANLRGYWDQTINGPYLVLAASLSEQQIEEHLPQWIGSAMVANLATGLPTWFCESVALALEENRRGRPRPATTAWTGAPAESVQRWIAGRLDPSAKEAFDNAAALSWKKHRPQLKEILQELQSGQRLESLLQTRSGGSVADFVTALLQSL